MQDATPDAVLKGAKGMPTGAQLAGAGFDGKFADGRTQADIDLLVSGTVVDTVHRDLSPEELAKMKDQTKMRDTLVSMEDAKAEQVCAFATAVFKHNTAVARPLSFPLTWQTFRYLRYDKDSFLP